MPAKTVKEVLSDCATAREETESPFLGRSMSTISESSVWRETSTRD